MRTPLLAGLMTFGAFFAAANGAGATLELEWTVPLPGVDGRIDHFAFDRSGQRLFVAALGNDTVEVIDLAKRRAVRSLTGFSEPQGIAFVPDKSRLYVANGGDGSVRVLDGASFEPVASIACGDDADNVRYDARSHRIYVGAGDGEIVVIDVETNRIVHRIPLPAHPESFQLEQGGSRLFVNVPHVRQLLVVDRESGKAAATRSLLPAGGNYPLALDEPGRRLFAGCRSPARLLVLSSDSGYETSSVPLHGDCDDVFYDQPRHRLYASCGEGFIDVFSTAGRDTPKPVESVATEHGARTSFFDGEHLYLAVPKRLGRDAEVRVYAATSG